MGIKFDDLNTNMVNGAFPDTLNMVRKTKHTVAFAATRAMTTATKVAVLPADATMLDLKFYPTVASNAATTATVTITATTVSGTVTLGTVDVKGTTTSAAVQGANFFNLELVPSATRVGDILIKATYAETGTASTAGGPFYFTFDYVR